MNGLRVEAGPWRPWIRNRGGDGRRRAGGCLQAVLRELFIGAHGSVREITGGLCQGTEERRALHQTHWEGEWECHQDGACVVAVGEDHPQRWDIRRANPDAVEAVGNIYFS
jgi:hypothetical protein